MTNHGLDTLTQLVAARELLVSRASALRRDPRVGEVVDDVDLRRYVETNDATGWLEATLHSGDIASWLFDLRWSGSHWEMTSRLEYRRHDKEQAVVLTRLPDEAGLGDESLVETLPNVVTLLLSKSLDDVLTLVARNANES